MSFKKQTIHDVSLKSKRVLLRADYNVPIDGRGQVMSDYRIQMNLPTLEHLLKEDCSVVIISHLGRPKNAHDKSCSLKPVAESLSKLLGKKVTFANDCVGEVAKAAADELKAGEVLLLENLRFYPGEEANDPDFAKQLVEASGAEVFVQDGFGVVHRAHASTDAITKLLPSVAGELLANEVNVLTGVMVEPKRPLMAIVGGAKIADKMGIFERFIKQADIIAVGGAMANTFLLAEGIAVGGSLVDHDGLKAARDILELARKEAKKRSFVFYLSQDGVVATDVGNPKATRVVGWDAHVLADIESYPKRPANNLSQVGKTEKILDIGPVSSAFIAGAIQLSNTVLWNGPLGVTETKSLQGPIGPFAHGTETIIEALSGQYGHKPFSIIGGGDTSSYIEARGLVKNFDHVSTGGGASLDLLAGKKLPGVESLADKG